MIAYVYDCDNPDLSPKFERYFSWIYRRYNAIARPRYIVEFFGNCRTPTSTIVKQTSPTAVL